MSLDHILGVTEENEYLQHVRYTPNVQAKKQTEGPCGFVPSSRACLKAR